MSIAPFLDNFASAIEGLQRDAINEDTRFRELPQWDSLALLSSLAMFDAEYQVTFSNEEITSCDTLDDLYKALQAKQN